MYEFWFLRLQCSDCWLDDRKGIRPVESWVLVCWCDDMTGALYCTSYIAPLVITTCITLSSNDIQNGDILVSANPGPPGKWPINWRETHTYRYLIVFDWITRLVP